MVKMLRSPLDAFHRGEEGHHRVRSHHVRNSLSLLCCYYDEASPGQAAEQQLKRTKSILCSLGLLYTNSLLSWRANAACEAMKGHAFVSAYPIST